MAFGCGQCLPCRFNRRRVWTHRIILEALQHTENSFLTLTYEASRMPLTSSSLATLRPKDLQDWLKRFRKAIAPLRIRFYGVGEYGDQNWRPHYHLALFGYPNCRYGNTLGNKPPSFQSQWPQPDCCDVCDLVRDTWGNGKIFIGELNAKSAQYVSGYITKKMTAGDGWANFLEDRVPEFSTQSNRPGIGFHAMHDVASELMRLDLDASQADVPSALRHGSRLLPLGRYLTHKLREMVGKDGKAPPEVLAERAKKMQALQYDSIRNKRGLQAEILAQNKTARESFIAREKIRKQRKTL